MKKIWIYMAGVALFAFFYEPLKALVSGPVFLGGAIVYFLLLRVLAEKFGK
jgi:cytochrome bd-type quinol oxidase subunit 2